MVKVFGCTSNPTGVDRGAYGQSKTSAAEKWVLVPIDVLAWQKLVMRRPLGLKWPKITYDPTTPLSSVDVRRRERIVTCTYYATSPKKRLRATKPN